jgi:hypothetical protein
VCEEEEDFVSDPVITEERILLLRPCSQGNSAVRIKKLIHMYESPQCKYTFTEPEDYIFRSLLNQPEYMDEDLFKIIKKWFLKALGSQSNSSDVATVCKKIGTLFDDSFKVYNVGLMY